MLIIDIFSRKLWAYAIKNRNQESISAVLQQYIDKYHPHIIISDNESSFISNATQKLFKTHSIHHVTAEPGDHKALGIVDAVSKTIKVKLYKYMKYHDTSKWKTSLETIIDQYNSTPHDGILGLTPDEATKPENFQKIFDYNLEKLMKIKKQNIQPGDLIRVRERKKAFERAYDEKYGKVGEVKSVDRKRATLMDDSTVALRRVRKIAEPDKNEIDTHNKKSEQEEHGRIEKKIKKEHLETANKEFEELPTAKTRQESKKQQENLKKALTSNEMKGLDRKDRFKFYDINKENVIQGKRERKPVKFF
jgi:hypothetical protein